MADISREYILDGRAQILGDISAPAVIIQPVSARGEEELLEEYRLTAELLGKGAAGPGNGDRTEIEAPAFLLGAFEIADWNRELSPWEAPPAFGDEPFGSGAGETLRFIESELIPEIKKIRSGGEAEDRTGYILGGYSLAGLFALWSASESDTFSAVMAASPSVWFPGFSEYAEAHPTRARAVYLSLGDREERTRNPLMRPVGDRIRALSADLSAQLGAENCLLEWNKGGHFGDSAMRCARGFKWTLERVCAQTRKGE